MRVFRQDTSGRHIGPHWWAKPIGNEEVLRISPDILEAETFEGGTLEGPGWREVPVREGLQMERAILQRRLAALELLSKQIELPDGWEFLKEETWTDEDMLCELLEVGALVRRDREGRIRFSVEQGGGAYYKCQIFDRRGEHIAGAELYEDEGYKTDDPNRMAGIEWCTAMVSHFSDLSGDM